MLMIKREMLLISLATSW